MASNPIEEIRATRAAIMREFNDDADKYCDYLEEKWKDQDLRYVTPKPRRIKTSSKSAVKTPRRSKAANRTIKRNHSE
jgi:hypothetical protein